jgi:hypothetical protein
MPRSLAQRLQFSRSRSYPEPQGCTRQAIIPNVAEQRSVRTPREPPADSPAIVYRRELYARRSYLDRPRIHHLDLARRFLEVAEGRMYAIDVLLIGAMSRSYSLVDGFLNAFDTWNPIVAAPVIRMQIDTLVRIAYMASAPSADRVASYVIGGGEFRQLKNSENKPLTDQRLLEHAEETHPWLRGVYEATSGWVHFSPAHVYAASQVTDRSEESDPEPDWWLSGAVPIRPEQIPLAALQELLGAMIKATEELFGYVEIWEARKGLPSGESRELRPDEDPPAQP